MILSLNIYHRSHIVLCIPLVLAAGGFVEGDLLGADFACLIPRHHMLQPGEGAFLPDQRKLFVLSRRYDIVVFNRPSTLVNATQQPIETAHGMAVRPRGLPDANVAETASSQPAIAPIAALTAMPPRPLQSDVPFLNVEPMMNESGQPQSDDHFVQEAAARPTHHDLSLDDHRALDVNALLAEALSVAQGIEERSEG